MPRLSEEDRVIIRRLIGDGKTNDEILQAIDNRCSKTNIYQMRHGIKKSGGGGRKGTKKGNGRPVACYQGKCGDA